MCTRTRMLHGHNFREVQYMFHGQQEQVLSNSSTGEAKNGVC